MIGRRAFLGGATVFGLSACSGFDLDKLNIPPVERTVLGDLDARLRLIEGAGDGTLGVEIFDTSSGQSLGNNENRRFGHCSSFKMSLAAMVLAGHAGWTIDADKRLTWTEQDLMFVSPFTEKRVDEGATMRELAEFTQKWSDNAAANILLRELGGPSALTAFWRSIGDEVSRLDRIEPALNNVPEPEFRDTTTPAAMARTVAKLVYGDVMPFAERQILRQWMIDTPTGVRRVRAGLPEEWVAGDKTGTSIWPGMGSLYVDIGFVEPLDRAPLTFATYFRARDAHETMDPQSEATLAKVGGVIDDYAEVDDKIPF